MPWSAARSTMRFATANRTSGSIADAGVVVADRDDRRAVLADQRQDALEALLLAGHGVDQRLADVDREPGLERLDDRGVDRQRHVDQRLDQPDASAARIAGSSAQRDPGVDVEHVGAGLDLGQGVALDAAEVAGLHLLGQELAAGRVDALADDHERPSKPMTTSRVAEERTVSVTAAIVRLARDRRLVGGSSDRAAGDAAALDQLGQPVLVVGRPRGARPRPSTSVSMSSPQRRCSRRHSSM